MRVYWVGEFLQHSCFNSYIYFEETFRNLVCNAKISKNTHLQYLLYTCFIKCIFLHLFYFWGCKTIVLLQNSKTYKFTNSSQGARRLPSVLSEIKLNFTFFRLFLAFFSIFGQVHTDCLTDGNVQFEFKKSILNQRFEYGSCIN